MGDLIIVLGLLRKDGSFMHKNLTHKNEQFLSKDADCKILSLCKIFKFSKDNWKENIK